MNKIMKNEYIEYFENIMNKRANFKNSKKIQNSFTNTQFNFSNDIYAKIKQDYNYLVFNSINLQNQFSTNKEYSSLFLTFTLDTIFHKMKQTKQGKYIGNLKYVKGNSINLGYKVLNKFFREIYTNFKIANEYEKISYIKVIEPMKASFTPHLHAIVFVKSKFLNQFQRYLVNKIDRNENLGIYEIETINDIERTSAYILKYIRKNFLINDESSKAYYGWRLKHKIRAYTFSKTCLNRSIFDKVTYHISSQLHKNEDFFEYFNEKNHYKIVDMFSTVNTEIASLDTGLVESKIINASEDDHFIINIKKDMYIKNNPHEYKINQVEKMMSEKNMELITNKLKQLKLYNSFKYFVFEKINLNDLQIDSSEYIALLKAFLYELKLEKRYVYTLNDFEVYKKHNSNCRYDKVYDKRDWSLINLRSNQ